jgi:sulfoxide reductase catalytic subunit YedY
MHIKKPVDIRSSEITPHGTYLRRRDFLAALITLPIASKMSTTTDAPTAKQSVTTYANYYEFGSDKGDAVRNGGAFKATPWSVAVEGQCAKPGTYTLEDILAASAGRARLPDALRRGWSMVIP